MNFDQLIELSRLEVKEQENIAVSEKVLFNVNCIVSDLKVRYKYGAPISCWVFTPTTCTWENTDIRFDLGWFLRPALDLRMTEFPDFQLLPRYVESGACNLTLDD